MKLDDSLLLTRGKLMALGFVNEEQEVRSVPIVSTDEMVNRDENAGSLIGEANDSYRKIGATIVDTCCYRCRRLSTYPHYDTYSFSTTSRSSGRPVLV